MSYYKSSDVDKLSIIYEKDVVLKDFYSAIKILEEGILDKLKYNLKNDLNLKVSEKDIQIFLSKKFDSDFQKTGQTGVNVTNYLLPWAQQNLLINTDANGNNYYNPKLPTSITNNVFRPITSQSSKNFLNSNDAKNLINQCLSVLIQNFKNSQPSNNPNSPQFPYSLLRTNISKGSDTLSNWWYQLGTGYMGKDVKLISLLPGSASLKSITQNTQTQSQNQPSNPFSNLTATQVVQNFISVIRQLQNIPQFKGRILPPSNPNDQAEIIKSLIKFMNSGDDEARAAAKLLFPSLNI